MSTRTERDYLTVHSNSVVVRWNPLEDRPTYKHPPLDNRHGELIFPLGRKTTIKPFLTLLRGSPPSILQRSHQTHQQKKSVWVESQLMRWDGKRIVVVSLTDRDLWVDGNGTRQRRIGTKWLSLYVYEGYNRPRCGPWDFPPKVRPTCQTESEMSDRGCVGFPLMTLGHRWT